MSNWHSKVPKARGFVKDRETGDPLVLDEEGNAWRQDPDKPGVAQKVGRYIPSLWEMIDKRKQESKQVELPPVEVEAKRPVEVKEVPMPSRMPPASKGGPIFEGPETEIKPRRKKR